MCVHVCLSVCLPVKSHITFGASEKTVTYTQWATEVEKFVEFSLKLLHSRATALPALYNYYHAVSHFLTACVLLKCHIDNGVGFG